VYGSSADSVGFGVRWVRQVVGGDCPGEVVGAVVAGVGRDDQTGGGGEVVNWQEERVVGEVDTGGGGCVAVEPSTTVGVDGA